MILVRPPRVPVHMGLTGNHRLWRRDCWIPAGSARCCAPGSATPSAPHGLVPFHEGRLQVATALTNPALDPISPMPEFKACAVAVSAVPDYAPSRLDSVVNGCP